jgi:hypothetical protein
MDIINASTITDNAMAAQTPFIPRLRNFDR